MPTGRRLALASAQARDHGAKRIVLLGDYVGYGADPDWTVTTVMDLVEQGAVAVLGNHDSAVSNTREHLNVEAQVVIEWTRGELGRLAAAISRQLAAHDVGNRLDLPRFGGGVRIFVQDI